MANFRESFSNYRASKATLFWSCAGVAVLTMVVGFSWGGWVTGGTAAEMAESQVEEARATLVATICVDRFMAAPEVRANLVALEEESSYSRDDFLSDAGWTTLAGAEEPVDGAAEICADRLAEVELPALSEPVAVEADAAPALTESTDGMATQDPESEPS